MARLRTFENPVTASFRLEKIEYEHLENIRWNEHKSFTDIMRDAVRQYIHLYYATKKE